MPMFRRRPLVRAAVIGGIARAGARSGTAAAMRDAAPAPEPAGAPQPDLVAELTKLAGLHDAGALDDAEFALAKARLLGG